LVSLLLYSLCCCSNDKTGSMLCDDGSFVGVQQLLTVVSFGFCWCFARVFVFVAAENRSNRNIVLIPTLKLCAVYRSPHNLGETSISSGFPSKLFAAPASPLATRFMSPPPPEHKAT
jgi:hypothetical protein